MALGLQHLHASGIVHRDIKPANVSVVDGYLRCMKRPGRLCRVGVSGCCVGTCVPGTGRWWDQFGQAFRLTGRPQAEQLMQWQAERFCKPPVCTFLISHPCCASFLSDSCGQGRSAQNRRPGRGRAAAHGLLQAAGVCGVPRQAGGAAGAREQAGARAGARVPEAVGLTGLLHPAAHFHTPRPPPSLTRPNRSARRNTWRRKCTPGTPTGTAPTCGASPACCTSCAPWSRCSRTATKRWLLAR